MAKSTIKTDPEKLAHECLKVGNGKIMNIHPMLVEHTYAANSYMSGAYAPNFFETENGVELIKEYAEYVKQARVRFQGPHGRVTLTLLPKASFSFSVANEDDKAIVQTAIRKLL